MGNKKNKRKKAVALQYDVKDVSPRVIAKGQGLVAERMLEKGEQEDIAIYTDEKLVEDLTEIDLGNTIPPELYEVVAEVLTFVSDLDRLQDKLNDK